MLELDNSLRVVRGWSWWCFRWQLLRGGKDIAVVRDQEGVLRHKRCYAPAMIREAIRQHKDNVQQGRMLKDDHKRRASRIHAADGRTYIVKEYRNPLWPGCFSRDQQGWLGSNRLVGSAECFAWQRNADLTAAYLLFQDAGDGDLYMAHDLTLPVNEAVPLYRQAGQMLAGLHRQGIYHADTKPSNFVFSTSASGHHRLTVIDCDDIRVNICLSRQRRLKNLAQFIGCLWCLTEMPQRIAMARAFLQGYCALSGDTGGPAWFCPADQLKLAAACHKLYPEHWEENQRLLQKVFAPEEMQSS